MHYKFVTLACAAGSYRVCTLAPFDNRYRKSVKNMNESLRYYCQVP